jgi:hypothetical protein
MKKDTHERDERDELRSLVLYAIGALGGFTIFFFIGLFVVKSLIG